MPRYISYPPDVLRCPALRTFERSETVRLLLLLLLLLPGGGPGTRMRLEGGGADEGPSGDQLEASHQDGQGSHSGDGVSLQVPGECSCRRPSKKADMQPAHAKAVSAKGVTRRPTKSEMPMMVAPMPSTKINDISVGPSRLCRLCPCQCSHGTRGTSIVDGLEILTEGQPHIRLHTTPNTYSHSTLHILAAGLLLVLGLQSVSTPLVAGRGDDAWAVLDHTCVKRRRETATPRAPAIDTVCHPVFSYLAVRLHAAQITKANTKASREAKPSRARQTSPQTSLPPARRSGASTLLTGRPPRSHAPNRTGCRAQRWAPRHNNHPAPSGSKDTSLLDAFPRKTL